MRVCGGFTLHDPARGFRAWCRGCGWRGKWRGLALSKVEADMEKHAVTCTNAPVETPRNGRLRPTKTSGTGAADTARPLAQTYRGGPSMADRNASLASREGGER